MRLILKKKVISYHSKHFLTLEDMLTSGEYDRYISKEVLTQHKKREKINDE